MKMYGVKKTFNNRKKFEKSLYSTKKKFVLSDDTKKKYFTDVRIINGQECYRISRSKEREEKALVYFFGGGYVMPAGKRDEKLLTYLADTLKADIFLLLYPLLPNVDSKEIYGFARDFYAELLKDYEPENIQFFGMSSGASLCMNMFLYDRYHGGELPYPGHMLLFRRPARSRRAMRRRS